MDVIVPSCLSPLKTLSIYKKIMGNELILIKINKSIPHTFPSATEKSKTVPLDVPSAM